ncbi:M2 family metallopeptidase [bacterium]|nr:M2 family metallopeptidase [bacterium]
MRIIADYNIKNNHYSTNFRAKKINPKTLITVGAGLGAGAVMTGCATIVCNGIVNMNKETKKFEKLRDKLAAKLEPIVIDSKKADWDFYTNSTDENMQKSQETSDKIYEIFHDEKTYNKFLAIDKTKLSKHDARQLKDLAKTFDEEINTGEARKKLRDKENEIAQKYNSYVPTIDGKEVTRLELSRITEEEKDTAIRKKAYEAKIKGGDLIAEELRKLVKMRNEYAKTKGYETYFDYMLKEEYDVDSEFLNKLIDEVYTLSSDKIRLLLDKRTKELKETFKTDKLSNYHYGLISESDPEKEVNEILEKHNVEDVTKQIYSGMGYDMGKMIEDGRLTLDLYPRKNKNTHGFCFDIDYGKDSRILANLRNNYSSLGTLCHEMGHSVYDLGVLPELPYFDRSVASMAFTEAVAMMMEDLPKKENVLASIVPEELLQRFKETQKEDDAYFVARSLEIIEFERDMYKNPEQDLKKLWQEKRAKYLDRDTEADNEWATIPHYLSHPAYYQNYFRAALMKAQMYNHLISTLGNITENKKSAEYIDKNIFSVGASIEEYDLIRQLTGKEFSSKDFARNLE